MVDQSIGQTAAVRGASSPPEVIEEIGPPPKSHYLTYVRLCSIVFVVVGWELAGRQVNPLFMSYPTAIIQSAIRVISTGELIRSFAESLRTLLVGFVAASLFGIVVGLSIG